MQPSITNLRRLAQLQVVGVQWAAIHGGLPPGFGDLSALTSLTLCKVRQQYPTQSQCRTAELLSFQPCAS
jgi:hypothetical protein